MKMRTMCNPRKIIEQRLTNLEKTVSMIMETVAANNTNLLIFVKKQSQELTRVNPDRNIFSINVELTSTFLLYRGLVHHHHEILKTQTRLTRQ